MDDLDIFGPFMSSETLLTEAAEREIGQVAHKWIPAILDQYCEPEQNTTLTFPDRAYYVDKALRAIAAHKELDYRAVDSLDYIVVASLDYHEVPSMDCMYDAQWNELVVARKPYAEDGEQEEVEGYAIISQSAC